MSIALNLFDAGAIATYPQLVDAIRDMSDDDAYSLDAINQAIRKVEAYLNRELRTPEMEAIAQLSWSGVNVNLPTNFLEMRELRLNGEYFEPLRQVSVGELGGGLPTAGVPISFSIVGQSLYFAPVPVNASARLLYYARIPSLTDATQNNWVLDRHPDVYVAGTLYHLARRERDGAAESSAATEFLSIVEAIKQAGMRTRYGGGRLIPTGMGQVRGARA